ncbi:MAG: tetratricopeptide repeat protein [bacterium]|nr:tetratricopeptide repeat protein [bacterium]
MIFYIFIIILSLFLIDHFYIRFASKSNENKGKKNGKIIIADDILLNSRNDIVVDDPLQYIDMGYYCEANKMNEKAIEYYEKAIKHGVKKQVVYYFLFELYEKEKKYDNLINMGNDILTTDPYDLAVNEKLAYFYQREEKQDIEKAYYYSYQAKKIKRINSMMFSASEEEKAKEINKAIRKYKEVISFDSQYSQAYKRLANLYRRNGKIKLAISNYKRAIKMDFQDVYSKLWLGIILGMRGGRRKEAQVLLNEVIATDSKSNDAQMAAYIMYYLEDDSAKRRKDDTFKLAFKRELDEVIGLFEKEIYENPSDHKVYWKLGMIYFVQEMFEEMKQKFEKVIDINPSSKEAKFAWCLLNSSFLYNC